MAGFLLAAGVVGLAGLKSEGGRSELVPEEFVLEPIGRIDGARQMTLAQAYRASMLW
jgi:hypothetical protein